MSDTAGRQADVGKLTPGMLKAAQTVFDDWWEKWADVHDLNGGQGDTETLFTALWDCWKKRK